MSDRSVYLEEFARNQIAQEELHGMEVRKMLRDVTVHFEQHTHADVHHPPATPPKKKGKAARVR